MNNTKTQSAIKTISEVTDAIYEDNQPLTQELSSQYEDALNIFFKELFKEYKALSKSLGLENTVLEISASKDFSSHVYPFRWNNFAFKGQYNCELNNSEELYNSFGLIGADAEPDLIQGLKNLVDLTNSLRRQPAIAELSISVNHEYVHGTYSPEIKNHKKLYI